MTELFPAIQLTEEETAETELPLYTDVQWDYKNNCPLFALGDPVMVTGLEAVKSWAYNALQTAREQYPIFTDQYGSDFEEVIGQAFTSDLKEAECRRYTEEALLESPYIDAVNVEEITFGKEGMLTVKASIQTVYGEEVISYG
jgi:hypothetical protein